MGPGFSVVDRGARVQQRSRSWDWQWGVDLSHMSQTDICPTGANSELSLTLDPSGDLNLMPWEVVQARSGAFRILRVSITDRPVPRDHLISSGAGLTLGEHS